MSRRVLLFGGSFNPIHLGHLRSAEEVREFLEFDEVLFLPAKQSPFKDQRELLPEELRLRLIESSIEENPFMQVSSLELTLPTPSYTLRTVQALQREPAFGDAELSLLIGSELLETLHKWWHVQELLQLVDIVVMARPGNPLEPDLINQIAANLGYGYNHHIELKDDGDQYATGEPSNPDSSDTAKPAAETRANSSRIPIQPIPPSGGRISPTMVARFQHPTGRSMTAIRCTPLAISSTDIRNRIALGRSIRYLVAPKAYSILMER